MKSHSCRQVAHTIRQSSIFNNNLHTRYCRAYSHVCEKTAWHSPKGRNYLLLGITGSFYNRNNYSRGKVERRLLFVCIRTYCFLLSHNWQNGKKK